MSDIDSEPVACRQCGAVDFWCQTVELVADYPLLLSDGGTLRFGPMEPDPDTEETLRYTCTACGTDADEDTRDAIEDRLR